MREFLIAALVIGAIAVAWEGCFGGNDEPASSGGMTPVERNNQQAKREQEACFKQANMIASQLGADAGSEKLNQCVEQFARDLQVEP